MTLKTKNTISSRIIAVMVNWNGKTYLQASISSVLAELAIYGGELLLIDNASTDGSVDFVQQNFPNVSILQTGENLGGSGGFSTGMRTALQCKDCEYIWLLDNDIVVEPNALGALLDNLKTTPTAGASGSQICLYDKPNTIQEIGSQLTPWLGGLQQCFSGQQRLPPNEAAFEVDYLAACSILIRRTCLEQIGVFGNFFIFYDDVEWGLRAKQSGWSMWGIPASVIRHQYGAIKPIIPWREYYRKRNRLALLAVYPTKKGGAFASLIYLGYLNYLIYSHKWLNFTDLYYAYLWARQDAIHGRLGKQDLTKINSPTTNIDTSCLKGFADILIDMSESVGEAMILIRLIHQNNEKANIFFPKHLKKHLSLIDSPSISISDKKNHSAVILGRNYKLKSYSSASCAFMFRNGQLISVSTLDIINNIATKLLAYLASLCLMPIHWLRLQWRFNKIKHL